MRCAMLLLLLGAGPLAAAPAETRFDIKVESDKYPQASPKDALSSVLKAIADKRVDYLLAHLAQPEWVDARVEKTGGQFKEVVLEASNWLSPATVKQIKGFLDEGEWNTSGDEAVVKNKKYKDREIRFKNVGGRWFMQNDYRPR